MSDKDVIVAVDLGTTDVKATLINPKGLIAATKLEAQVQYPQPGWAEQDPQIVHKHIVETIKTLLKDKPEYISRLAGLTFTSQMQGILALDRNGKPLTPLITWLDSRAADLTQRKMLKGLIKVAGIPISKLVKYLKITGGAPGNDGKSTLCRAYWIKETLPEIYAQTYKLVDTKDYAVYLATDQWVTSIDYAFVTWIMDTRPGRMCWSKEICAMHGLDPEKFLEIKPSIAIIGNISEAFAKATGLPVGLPVVNGAGDLLTSAIGSGAIDYGELHVNIGTAGWVGCHYPKSTKDIPHYTGAIAAGIPNKYLIVSKQETLGGALEWFKNVLYPSETRQLQTDPQIFQAIDYTVHLSSPGANNVIFTPWLMGERSPVNNPYLRGQFFNLGLYTTRADMLRAIFEGVAYNLAWGIQVVEKLSKKRQDHIRIIGGASQSDIWCQIFADVWQKKVIRMQNPQQASAIGAACIAMVGLGIFKDFSSIDQITHIEKEFLPDSNGKLQYKQLFKVYQQLSSKTNSLFKELNAHKL